MTCRAGVCGQDHMINYTFLILIELNNQKWGANTFNPLAIKILWSQCNRHRSTIPSKIATSSTRSRMLWASPTSPRSQRPQCSPTTKAMSKNLSITSSPNSQPKPKPNLQSRHKWHRKKKRSSKHSPVQCNQANTSATISNTSHQSRSALDSPLISLSA